MLNNIRPYLALMRLEKPVGFLLLWIPCLWGLYAGLHPFHLDKFLFYGFIFLLGSILMRGAGCVINDYFDRDIDLKVERTKDRPIASGVIKPKNALMFAVLLCLISSSILFFLTPKAILVSLFSVILVIFYPLMKRITYWPQAFLGITFNIGILVGFLTVNPWWDYHILWLYLSAIFMTLGYDTIYAFQDIEDDMGIGVKSSAQKVKSSPKIFISLFYLSASVCFCIYFKDIISGFIFCFLTLLSVYFWKPSNGQSSLFHFKLASINMLLPLIYCIYWT